MCIKPVIYRTLSFAFEESKMDDRARGATAVVLLLLADIPPELRRIPEQPNIYDLLSMPSLDETTMMRISFAPERPSRLTDLPPSAPAGVGNSAPPAQVMSDTPVSIFKRDQSPALRACQVRHEWVHIQTTTDIFNQEVEVSQIQWFWHTTCLHLNESCYGFTATEGTTTECRETSSWVMAWARAVGETDYSWRHIAIPTCCACAVTHDIS